MLSTVKKLTYHQLVQAVHDIVDLEMYYIKYIPKLLTRDYTVNVFKDYFDKICGKESEIDFISETLIGFGDKINNPKTKELYSELIDSNYKCIKDMMSLKEKCGDGGLRNTSMYICIKINVINEKHRRELKERFADINDTSYRGILPLKKFDLPVPHNISIFKVFNNVVTINVEPKVTCEINYEDPLGSNFIVLKSGIEFTIPIEMFNISNERLEREIQNLKGELT